MTRDEAYNLMTEMLQNKNLQKHGLAVEVIMKALCKYLKGRLASQGSTLEPEEFEEEEWAIVGLLHDADYELVEKDPSRHTLATEEKLREIGGVSDRIINGIKGHAPLIKPNRDNYLEKAVFASDELSGLITACALVQPDKKLASVSVNSVMKKFKVHAFAAGALRENILSCEKELNIPLEEFVAIALKAMQGISNQLGL